jgi:hypothetical protein
MHGLVNLETFLGDLGNGSSLISVLGIVEVS